MTANQVIRAIARRWYVLLLLVILTLVAAGFVRKAPGVYTAQVDVVFLPPSTANRLQDQTDGSVQFAAVVEREFNGNRGNAPIPLQTATLYGEGIRQGHTVTLHNSGGQWTNNFDRPDISVEVVDSSPARVDRVMTSLTGRITALANRLQVQQGVSSAEHIGTILSPSTTQVNYIPASTTRATAATLMMGFLAAVLLSFGFDRLALRWTRTAGTGRSVLRQSRKRLVRARN